MHIKRQGARPSAQTVADRMAAWQLPESDAMLPLSEVVRLYPGLTEGRLKSLLAAHRRRV